MTTALSSAFALLAVAFYLLARLMTENAKLRKARRRTAALMRRVRQQRDALVVVLGAGADEYEELCLQKDELESELVTYRKEDARRDAQRVAARMRLN